MCPNWLDVPYDFQLISCMCWLDLLSDFCRILTTLYVTIISSEKCLKILNIKVSSCCFDDILGGCQRPVDDRSTI